MAKAVRFAFKLGIRVLVLLSRSRLGVAGKAHVQSSEKSAYKTF